MDKRVNTQILQQYMHMYTVYAKKYLPSYTYSDDSECSNEAVISAAIYCFHFATRHALSRDSLDSGASAEGLRALDWPKGWIF